MSGGTSRSRPRSPRWRRTRRSWSSPPPRTSRASALLRGCSRSSCPARIARTRRCSRRRSRSSGRRCCSSTRTHSVPAASSAPRSSSFARRADEPSSGSRTSSATRRASIASGAAEGSSSGFRRPSSGSSSTDSRICSTPFDDSSFPPALAEITSFCGYVVSHSLATQLGATRPSSRRPRVLATVGGGDDGYPILDTFVDAAEGSGWDAMIVAGAYCPQDRRDLLRSKASAAGVAYRDFVPGLPTEFSSLDALVCMGGYNTLAEVAASGVPAVCIPRREPTRDQLIRARAFESRGLVRVLDPDDLAPDLLREEIETALSGETPARRPRTRSRGRPPRGAPPRGGRGSAAVDRPRRVPGRHLREARGRSRFLTASRASAIRRARC